MTILRSKCCKAPISTTGDANGDNCQACSKCGRICEAEIVSKPLTPKPRPKLQALVDDPLENLNRALPPKTVERATERVLLNRANARIAELEAWIVEKLGQCETCYLPLHNVDEIMDYYPDCAECKIARREEDKSSDRV